MTIKKAMRRLQRYIRWRKPEPDDDFNEAVQLGIEALKYFQEDRRYCLKISQQLLPGETKE